MDGNCSEEKGNAFEGSEQLRLPFTHSSIACRCCQEALILQKFSQRRLLCLYLFMQAADVSKRHGRAALNYPGIVVGVQPGALGNRLGNQNMAAATDKLCQRA